MLVLIVILPKFFLPQASVDQNITDQQTAVEYSYFSVVAPVWLVDIYTSSAEDCSIDASAPLELIKPTDTSPVRFSFALTTSTAFASGSAFDNELANLGEMLDLLAQHKLKATIYSSSAFVDTATTLNKTELIAWAKQGHEMAMAVESAPERVAYGSWLGAMHDHLEALEKLCDCDVRGWSGGGAYHRLYEVGRELGLTTHVGYQPSTPESETDFVVMNPWTPGGSGSPDAMKVFDPFGSVVYLPDGIHAPTCPQIFKPLNEATLSFSTKALYATMHQASTERVNVFRLIVPLSELEQTDVVAADVFDAWLSEAVDPLTRSGKLISSTDSASADAFIAWLDQNIGKIELK